jgi:hypothetical protein
VIGELTAQAQVVESKNIKGVIFLIMLSPFV